MLGSFSKQDHLLNLIISGGYAKRWPKCASISKQKLMQLKIWSMNFFSYFDCQRTFPQEKFWVKKIWGYMVNFWENEAFYVERHERAEAATSSYSAPGNFSQYVYSVFVAKNQKKIQSACLVHKFFFTDISHGYWAAILKKNYLWLLPIFR